MGMGAGSVERLRPLVVAMLLAVGVLAGPDGAHGAMAQADPAIDWRTDQVQLSAAGLAIRVGDQVFTAAGLPVGVDGDAGGPERWSLETEWREQGVEMWLHLYFASDGTDWWVSEARTRDGELDADWIYYPGPVFRTPLGETFEGDVRLEGTGRTRTPGSPVSGILEMTDLRLAVSPRSLDELYAAPEGGGIEATVDPFEPGQPLHCSGFLQLDPATAHERILEAGYRVSWRSLHPTRPAEPLTSPPAGTIESSALGSHGEVIVFVADPAFGAAPQPTLDPSCPVGPSPSPA